jgi:hypothetical protein
MTVYLCVFASGFIAGCGFCLWALTRRRPKKSGQHAWLG